jgi:hypothetical protein
VTDVGQPSSRQESPPTRHRTWVLGRKRAEEAERRKLRSHIEVLQQRARRFCNHKDENGPARAVRLVTGMLSQGPDYRDMESAHQYADQLEEHLPLIADDAYLRAVLTYELAGGDPDEPIKLSRVADDAALRELVSVRQDARSSTTPFAGGKFAESLSLLYKIRADHLRHERLMAKLRGAYLPYLAGLIVILLGLLALAILSGGNPSDASPLAGWAQLVAVGAAGALGSVLAATFKLRDTVQLDPLRGIAAITFIQPLIGAAFGLMSWLILTSGLVTIGGTNNQAWPTQVVVAFASGLSEPVFLNIVGKVVGPQR